jgi:hypothetical protein
MLDSGRDCEGSVRPLAIRYHVSVIYERSLPSVYVTKEVWMKEDWDDLIKQQDRRGMKPAAFCRARGIDPSKFGYQRQRRKGPQKKGSFVRVDRGAVTL